MKLRHLAIAAVVTAVLGGPAAHAFSVENPSQGSGGSAQFADPDQRFDKLTDPDATSRGSAGSAEGGTPAFSFSGSRQNPYPYRVMPPNPPKALHPDSDHLFWGNNPRGQY